MRELNRRQALPLVAAGLALPGALHASPQRIVSVGGQWRPGRGGAPR